MNERVPSPYELVTNAPSAARQQTEAQGAFHREKAIKFRIGKIREYWVELAGLLYDFRENEEWRKLGHETFEAWLAQPDVELSRSEVFKLTQAHQELVLNRGVEPKDLARIGFSKVSEVLPVIRQGKVTVEVALAAAEELPRSDLRQEVQSWESLAGETFAPEPEWLICESCGSRYRAKAA